MFFARRFTDLEEPFTAASMARVGKM